MDQAVAGLNVKTETLKGRLIALIRSSFATEESISDISSIPAEDLIAELWGIDDPDAIRRKKKNLSSLKSAINKTLKQLTTEGNNPEGLIISQYNVFAISDEHKNDILEKLGINASQDPGDLLAAFRQLVDEMVKGDTGGDGQNTSINLLDELDKARELVANLTGKQAHPYGNQDGEEGGDTGTGTGTEEVEEFELAEDEDIEIVKQGGNRDEIGDGSEDGDESESAGGVEEEPELLGEMEELEIEDDELEEIEIDEVDEISEQGGEGELDDGGSEGEGGFGEGDELIEEADEIEIDEDEIIEEEDEIIEEEDEIIEEEDADEFEEIESAEENGGTTAEDDEPGSPMDISHYIEPDEALASPTDTLMESHNDYLKQIIERFMPKFIKITSDSYQTGRRHPRHNERPRQLITLDTFHISQLPVTNDLFDFFVRETGYETDAEKTGFGTVVEGRISNRIDPYTGHVIISIGQGTRSHREQGANWRHPSGPDSSLENKTNHPVVQVSRRDCQAFASWAGKRLPTEDEWEAAARGSAGFLFPWGNEWNSKLANCESSHIGDTTPVLHHGKESMSPFGLYDMLGNVFEWTATLFQSPTRQGSGNVSPIYILKGCSWSSKPDISAAARLLERETWSNIIGFRCAV